MLVAAGSPFRAEPASSFLAVGSTWCAARMQKTTEHSTSVLEAENGLREAAVRAADWAVEPFLREGEDPAVALAPGTARRRALDDALAEIDADKDVPSPRWRVRYGLMLGLERVLSERPPRLPSGTELRRHQVDALAGLLTELIAANQAEAKQQENGVFADVDEDDEEPSENGEVETIEEIAAVDPGAVRRFRFRHPTASG